MPYAKRKPRITAGNHDRSNTGTKLKPHIAQRVRAKLRGESTIGGHATGGVDRKQQTVDGGESGPQVQSGESGREHRGAALNGGQSVGRSGQIDDGARRSRRGSGGVSSNPRNPRSGTSGRGTGTRKSQPGAVRLVSGDVEDEEPEPKRVTPLGAKVGKGKGRAAQDPMLETFAKAGVLGVGYRAVFESLAFARGPHWRISDEENRAISVQTRLALECLPEEWLQAFDSSYEKYIPIVGLVMLGCEIIGPRLKRDAEVSAIKRQATRDGRSGGGTNSGTGAGVGEGVRSRGEAASQQRTIEDDGRTDNRLPQAA